MDLKEKVKKLPSCPGVYLMKDSLGSIIYVGKSKNLKSRVGSYFINSKSHPPKVLKLVKNLKDFDYLLTDTEFEAFMLECKLIKEIKPLYNRQIKNPKSYTYVKIEIDREYPDIKISNEADKSDGNLYFGPYTNRNTVERGLQGIKECCRILCTGSSWKASPCLNYSLGLCIGACLSSTPREQYLAIFDKITALFKGNDLSIIEALKTKMDSAAEKFDFENAAKYRDYLSAVNCLIGRNKVLEYTRENKNIAVLEPLSDDSVKFFLIKGNKVLLGEKYSLKDMSMESIKNVLKINILTHFNNEAPSSPIKVGREELDESQIIYTYLKSSDNCGHIIIREKWLTAPNDIRIDHALDDLLALKLNSTKSGTE
ncbi:MAG: UvrB/UvrC motif-containing protein [Caulobacteraceae bacterium]